MCRKSFFLIIFILFLCLVSSARADSNLIAHYEFGDIGNFNNSVGDDVGEPIGDAHIIWDEDRDSYVLSLDGDGDYVYYESEWQGIVDDAITVAVWMKTNSLSSYNTVVGLGYAWRLYGGQDDNVIFQIMDTAPEATIIGVTDVNDGVWHHVAGSYDGTQYNLFIDGRLEASVATSGGISAGTSYYGCIGAHYKKNDDRDPRRFFAGLVDDVRIYNSALSESEIWQVFTFKTGSASKPNPADGEIDVPRDTVLSWSPGNDAAQHDVYFGTNFNDLNEANTSDTMGVYQGRQDANSYTPTETLEWGGTYFWRIDQVNDVHSDSPWKGNVWSFGAADFLLLENFEDYNDYAPDRIFDTWMDGYGDTTNGSTIGYSDPVFINGEHFVETNIVHSGSQSMPYFYDNTTAGNSEATMILDYPSDWTEEDVNTLTLWFRGYPSSVGSFTEGPAGTYTMSATGSDIFGTSDEFHFAFKQLSGPGSIVVKVESVGHTDDWTKAGVMIRETLEPGSKFAAVYITPGKGCRFQAREETGAGADSDSSVVTDEQAAITVPYWVKLEREVSGNFRAYYSSDGITWQATIWRPNIFMSSDVYIGLALTSHNSSQTCEARFSNISINGTVSQQEWMNQDIGIISNIAEPMYVVLNGSAFFNPDTTEVLLINAIVYHDNPDAVLINEWTEWNIDLQTFADQGINLMDVDSITIGFGDRDNPQPGGSGLVYFDDIRLYRPLESEQEPVP